MPSGRSTIPDRKAEQKPTLLPHCISIVYINPGRGYAGHIAVYNGETYYSFGSPRAFGHPPNYFITHSWEELQADITEEAKDYRGSKEIIDIPIFLNREVAQKLHEFIVGKFKRQEYKDLSNNCTDMVRAFFNEYFRLAGIKIELHKISNLLPLTLRNHIQQNESKIIADIVDNAKEMKTPFPEEQKKYLGDLLKSLSSDSALHAELHAYLKEGQFFDFLKKISTIKYEKKNITNEIFNSINKFTSLPLYQRLISTISADYMLKKIAVASHEKQILPSSTPTRWQRFKTHWREMSSLKKASYIFAFAAIVAVGCTGIGLGIEFAIGGLAALSGALVFTATGGAITLSSATGALATAVGSIVTVGGALMTGLLATLGMNQAVKSHQKAPHLEREKTLLFSSSGKITRGLSGNPSQEPNLTPAPTDSLKRESDPSPLVAHPNPVEADHPVIQQPSFS
jgi:hypothetical protein